MKNKKASTKKILYLAWISVSLLYCYQYILRVSSGIMIEDLRYIFQISAEKFSTLGSFYLYSYAFMQIPIGFFLDRIGVRLIILIAAVFCILANILFIQAEFIWEIQLSRILIGIGSAPVYIAAMKIIADFITIHKRGIFMGLTLGLGALGPLISARLIVCLLDKFGWRLTKLTITIFGFLIFFIIYFSLSRNLYKNFDNKEKYKLKSFIIYFWQIIKDYHIWLYALLAIGVYSPLAAMADLWGVAFLIEKYLLTRNDAAQLNMILYLGLAIGCFIFPGLCEKNGYLNRSIQVFLFILLIIFSIIIYSTNLNKSELTILLFFMGLFCGTEVMCFTGAARNSTVKNSGLIFGFVNTMNMLGGGLLQDGIGIILDWSYKRKYNTISIKNYEVNDFLLGFSLLFLIIFVSFILSLYLKNEKVQNTKIFKKKVE